MEINWKFLERPDARDSLETFMAAWADVYRNLTDQRKDEPSWFVRRLIDRKLNEVASDFKRAKALHERLYPGQGYAAPVNARPRVPTNGQAGAPYMSDRPGTAIDCFNGYCMACKSQREARNAKQITMTNGGPAMEGNCSGCGTKIFKIADRQVSSSLVERSEPGAASTGPRDLAEVLMVAQKILQAETKDGFQDRIVVGGLTGFIGNFVRQVADATSDPEFLVLATNIREALQDYGAFDRSVRAERLSSATALIAAVLESARAR